MIHAEVDLPAEVYKDVERIARASKRSSGQVLRDLITQALRNKTRTRRGGSGSPIERHFGTMPGLWTDRDQDAADYSRQLRRSMQPRS
jgi:hypothetical protein